MGEMRQGISAELMLLNWNESANSGCKLIFEISADELEPFKALRTRAGKKVSGQRFAAVLVLIDDDETPVSAEQAPKPADKEVKEKLNDNAELASPARRGGFSDAVGPRARLAVQWCAQERFANWLDASFPHISEELGVAATGAHEEFSKRVLRDLCGIDSRKELDTNEEAGKHFDTVIRHPYSLFLKNEGVPA